MKRTTAPATTFADAALAHAEAQSATLADAVSGVAYSIAAAKKSLADAEAKLARLANG